MYASSTAIAGASPDSFVEGSPGDAFAGEQFAGGFGGGSGGSFGVGDGWTGGVASVQFGQAADGYAGDGSVGGWEDDGMDWLGDAAHDRLDWTPRALADVKAGTDDDKGVRQYGLGGVDAVIDAGSGHPSTAGEWMHQDSAMALRGFNDFDSMSGNTGNAGMADLSAASGFGYGYDRADLPSGASGQVWGGGGALANSALTGVALGMGEGYGVGGAWEADVLDDRAQGFDGVDLGVGQWGGGGGGDGAAAGVRGSGSAVGVVDGGHGYSGAGGGEPDLDAGVDWSGGGVGADEAGRSGVYPHWMHPMGDEVGKVAMVSVCARDRV